MKRNCFTLLALLLAFLSQAQNATDALRYSYLQVGGTARTIGVGGALGALGADFAALSCNPAGLALYRTSEFVVTPGLYISNSKSQLTKAEDNPLIDRRQSNFHFDNIGFIFNTKPRSRKWTAVNVGIGLNRLANFHERVYFEGRSKGSITDRFLEQINQDGESDPFGSELGINTEAVYDLNNDQVYETDFQQAPNVLVPKRQLVDARGSTNELLLSVAGNYDEKLMIGGTIGVPFLSYKETKTYNEDDPNDSIPFFNSLEFREDLSTSGVGINLKLGLIYRISQMFRIGLAVHTPTAYRMTDNFTNGMSYDFTINGNRIQHDTTSPSGSFSYRLRTPWRVMGSLGIVIGHSGFVSADVEWVDYTSASFRAPDGSADDDRYLSQVNNNISTLYQDAVNIRLGGELALSELRLRAGAGLYGSPFAGNSDFNHYYTAGIGLREKSFYLDFAYKLEFLDEKYSPYLLADSNAQPRVNTTLHNNQFVLTIGFKF